MGLFDKIKGRRDDDAVLKAREHVKRCEQYQHAGRISEALAEAKAAVRLDPESADGYYGMGRCHHAIARAENERAGGNIYFLAGLENLEQAIIAYRRVIALQPAAADGFLSLGLASDNACRADDAEKFYKEAIRLDPNGLDGIDARFNLGLLLHMQAIGWAGMKAFPNSFRLSVTDTRLARSFELAEEGIRLGEQRLQRDPDYLSELVQKHNIVAGWYVRVKRGDRATEHYRAILRLSPNDSEANKHVQKASGDSEIDDSCLRAVPLDPGRKSLLWMDPAILSMLSSNTVTMIQQGNRIVEAVFSEADVEWARKVNAHAVPAQEAAGQDRYAEAIELYRAALKLAPGCDLYLMSIGCCYANLGDLSRGLKYLERAAEISPQEERIRQNLVGVHQAARGQR